MVSSGDIVDQIIIQGLIFRFAEAPEAGRVSTFSSLEESVMKQDAGVANINPGCRNGCTATAARPLLPGSFPSFRVTTVKELNLAAC